MNKENCKKIIYYLILLIVFVNMFFLNIVLHEIGHYMVAEYYGLEPEIEFKLGNVTGTGFNFEGMPLAYTSFNDNRDRLEIGVVAIFGPFVNLILGIIFFIGFLYSNKEFVKDIYMIGFVVSIGAFIMNLIPIGESDGVLIFEMIGIK